MSDNVRPTLDDLTECWCGYQAAGVSDLMSHQLYCDPHNTAPKVIDDQRKRITELEAQLAECRKIRRDYSIGVDPIEYNEMCHKTAGMHDQLVELEAQLAAAQEYVATLESMVTSHSDKVELAAAKYYRTLNTQMCVRCQKPGHRCECEPIDFEDMY